MKTALKMLAAASVVLGAGLAQAQSYSVQGLDREIPANAVGGTSYINIDQDLNSACLGYLSGIKIDLSSGGTQNGYTYGTGAAWEKTWTDGCGILPVQTDFFGSGFRVIYEWGASGGWHSGCDNSTGGGAAYNLVSTTDPDPAWDCAQLVVTVDATFALQSINLITRKQGVPLQEVVYDLY